MPLAKLRTTQNNAPTETENQSPPQKLITIITSRAFDSTPVARSCVCSSSYFDSMSNCINGFTMVLSTHIIIIYLYQHIECYWTSNTLICWLCITMFGGHLAECSGSQVRSGHSCAGAVSLCGGQRHLLAEHRKRANSYKNFSSFPSACKWFVAVLPMWTRCNVFVHAHRIHHQDSIAIDTN